ncbi:MAG: 50S ribosomal protein L13 [Spirochaetia bacterium]|jgi:large subunit ribosomal protein L13
MKTIFVKPKDVERKWWLVDAEDQVLGRLASRIVLVLRGKHKPIYSPHMETGDFVVVVNAEKVKITGNKREEKLYYRHSGYPGGLKTEVLGKILMKKPTFPLEHAIKGMLPKGKMGRKIFLNVKIYAGPEHPHEAQKPEKLEF